MPAPDLSFRPHLIHFSLLGFTKHYAQTVFYPEEIPKCVKAHQPPLFFSFICCLQRQLPPKLNMTYNYDNNNNNTQDTLQDIIEVK